MSGEKYNVDSKDKSDTNYEIEDDFFEEDGKTKAQKCIAMLKHNVLLFLLMLAMIAGIGMGLGIRTYHPTFREDPRNLMYFEFPGELLMRMLKMCILPLIISSIITGMASLPTEKAGRLGGRAVLYYVITTFMAVILGIVLVTTIKPGQRGGNEIAKLNKNKLVNPVDALLDLVRNAFPNNLITACFQQTITKYTTDTEMYNDTSGNFTELRERDVVVGYKITTTGGSNVLGLLVFCIVFGVIIGRGKEKGLPLKQFFSSLEYGIISVVRIVIWYAPIGIAFLMAGRIISMDDPAKRFKQLGWYMMTVLVGLAIHGFIILPTIYAIFVRKNPFRLMFQMGEALVTALGTASSSATLPLTLKCLITKARIDSRIGQFVLPVGATMNMDGTALYEAVASIFIAQYNGIDLNVGQVVIVSVTATAAAIGAAGVPEAGLVTMAIVLTAVGLPTDDIGLIYAVDWFLDRFRTCLNVWGDSIGAGVVESLSKKDLKKMDEMQEKQGIEDEDFDDTMEVRGGKINNGFVDDKNSRL